MTSRFSRGHAGRYVTSRYSRGSAGRYVTSRFSRGHAAPYVSSRYSRGHYIMSTGSRWYSRSERLGRYRHHYRYYGRDSNYYFSHGRWLPFPPGYIHGPGSGYAFRYGRWVADSYPVFVPVPVYADYYYDGGWHEEAPLYMEAEIVAPEELEPVSEYVSVLTKAERGEPEIITRGYDLDWWQAKRVEDLISKQIIESILTGGEAGENARVVFDKRKQRLVITATSDDIMRIHTIVDDDRTYKRFTQQDFGGLAVDAIPLVDLRFVESDPSAALRVAADNYSGADEILRSSEVSPARREWWFNHQLGTMTVFDSAQNLDTVYELLETRPYFKPESGGASVVVAE